MHRFCKIIRLLAIEVKCMIARYLVEDWNVTGNDGQLVLRGLDERQAKAFTFRGSDETSGTCIYRLQVFVADAFQPEETLAQFGVAPKSIYQLFHHPALLADYD